jgi:hypothetical protein
MLPHPVRSGGGAVPLSSSSLRSSFFDDVLKFFDRFQQPPDNGRASRPESEGIGQGAGSGSRYDPDDDGDDETPAGTTRIVTVPVRSIKPGGLRLFLMLYLLGQQNTPDPKSWTAHQPTTPGSSPEEYVLEYRYRDMSAALTLTLVGAAGTSSPSSSGTESSSSSYVAIDRTGSRPSVAYLAQETAVVQGILDELQQMATDESVGVSDRLLVLSSPDSILRARDGLAFL